MTETVVRVSTIEEWKSVLDVWFKQGYIWQGYSWSAEDKEYSEYLFENGGRYLFLDDYITYSHIYNDRTKHNYKLYIEYSEFMKEQ